MNTELRKIYLNQIYLSLSIQEMSKAVMYKFWYDYMRLKSGKKKVKLCYMDTDSFIAYIKMKGIYVDIATDST